MKWIKCSEHLPPQLGFYLTFISWYEPSCDINEFCYSKKEGYHWENLVTHQIPEGRITHWMPLPDAPEVEK